VTTDVFGLTLGDPAGPRELARVKGSDEACIHGFERTFDPLDITVGYGFDNRVRRIFTANPRTAIGGIHPGEDRVVAREKLLRAGFEATVSRDRFVSPCCSVTLLSGAGGTVSGIVLEKTDSP
jgi:hypothetical protein